MIYGMSSIVGRFLNYMLVPLYTYKIAAASGGYGMVTRVYSLTALMLVILIFGMETTFFYFASKYKERADKVFSTAFLSVGVVAALFVGLVMLFGVPMSNVLGCPGHPEYLRVMGTVVAIDAVQAILFALLRYEGRAWKFAFLKLLFIFLNIGLNLLVFLGIPAYVSGHPGAFGWYDENALVGYIFVMNLICTALVTLGFLPELRKVKHGMDWSLLKEMLKYTWPLLLFGIAGILNQVADKICYYFIDPSANGDVQLGIYGACTKIAMIMAMITQAFRYAYEPIVFGGIRDKNSKDTQAMVMKYFVMFALLAFLTVMAYMDVLKHIISASYWEGLRVVPIVMMAEIFMSIYFNLSFWYKLNGQTWWGAIFSAIGCAALLAVNFAFVPKYGYMACAWGGFTGYGVCMLLSYFVGRKKSPVPYQLGTILGYFALALGLYGVSVWLKPECLGWELALNTVLLMTYVAVALWCERDMIMAKLKRR